jgi:hypothetical protein
MGHESAEPQPTLHLLDGIEPGDRAQMNDIGDRKARLHPVYHVDAAGHIHGSGTGCCLYRHRCGGAAGTVQPEVRDQLARSVHCESRPRGGRRHMTPPTGIPPPNQHRLANSPSATMPYKARPIPQSRTIAASTVAVSPAEEANMMM